MNILFIDIDTLRPDHMGCYGYGRNTTPCIDEIAREGVVFRDYYCADAPCLPSRASLVSGTFGLRHGAVGHGGTCADKRYLGETRDFRDEADENNLWHVFRKAGMYTASISTFAERHSSQWFNSGFHETHNVGCCGVESGERVLPVALDWLERNKNRDDWFLHLHLWDPHTPYRAPAAFGNPFADDPAADWISEDVLQEHLRHVGPHSLHELNMYNGENNPLYPRQPGSAQDLAGVKRIFDGYDCGIRYADTLLGQVFDKLREYGIYEDTAILITSDHGENMGELGIYAEHATADHATCHIPMIVKWPGIQGGRMLGGLHYNLDLAPTVAELLDVDGYANWDGESFAAAFTEQTSCGREYLVLSQMAHVCQRTVRFDDWLYMRSYHDGLHLFDKEMLFNLKDDPYEQTNLCKEQPELCQKAAKYLLDWHDDLMAVSQSQIDPLWTVLREGAPFHAKGRLESYCERLEQTGRGEGAKQLKARREQGWFFGK